MGRITLLLALALPGCATWQKDVRPLCDASDRMARAVTALGVIAEGAMRTEATLRASSCKGTDAEVKACKEAVLADMRATYGTAYKAIEEGAATQQALVTVLEKSGVCR